jgi:diaminohydroxyphosphoribosylaminopyrimidine deaminase/5-amino-6-(5-phosphoribosylamino)uracil reductase
MTLGNVEKYMQEALQEAQKAQGRTTPNPMVGCLVVKGQRLISKGFHGRAGGPHAEVVALRRAGEEAFGAEMYVTLEPCSHHGRTGPCTEAIIAAGIKRVIVGVKDPNPIVNGRGIRRLRASGIKVEVGILKSRCTILNEAYNYFIRERRPYVLAKVAQSLDGKVATKVGESKWITSKEARRYGHSLRNVADAMLVGVGTILADDPQLTCRLRGGRDPIRLILDSRARTPLDANVVQIAQRSKAPTWVVVGPKASSKKRSALERAGVETFSTKLCAGKIDLEDLLLHLGERELLSILIEGGPTVLGSFFEAKVVNKLYAFVAPILIGGVEALSSIGGTGPAHLLNAARLAQVEVETVGRDFLVTGYPRWLGE